VGMLAQAAATIDATIEQLRPVIEDDAVAAIIVIEPSCLSAIKDDWLELKCNAPMALRKKLAAKAMLLEEFVERRWETHPKPPKPVVDREIPEVVFHAHCHQKALWGANSSAAVLRRLVGDKLKVLDTGCCGMAGSFGYDANKYDLSMRIANLDNTQGADSQTGNAGGGVLPYVRKNPSAFVVATGTSCRHQIKDGTADEPLTNGGLRHAMHPVQLMDLVL